jgi:hypothetical protein
MKLTVLKTTLLNYSMELNRLINILHVLPAAMLDLEALLLEPASPSMV